MKNIIFLITFLSAFNSANSQTENDNYRQMSAKFVSFFNESKNDSIFAMFSPEMKTALPIEKVIQVRGDLKMQLGSIKKIRFVRLQNVSAFYETTFDKAVFGMTLSLNSNNEISGLLFQPYTVSKEIIRNTTKMQLPFKGEWSVVWGGDTKELNYHVESVAQKNAFDILIIDNKGSTYKGTGLSNEDFYAFGKELYAPCDGEVVLVVDGIKDNTPGTLNPIYMPGNTVIIKTANSEYVLLAHFKQHSIVVKQGQTVSTGNILGLCGNSGNSSEPHLHFHLQNVEDIIKATGAKCYFDKIIVNGVLKSDYSPLKGDKISSN